MRNTQWVQYLYLALAVVGLTATNAQLGPYFKLGFVGGNYQFWVDTVANPASTFIVVDIFVLGIAVLSWMFGECRRIGIGAKWAWLYFVGSSLIGISTFFPLFLAHRQRRLAPAEQSAPAGSDFFAVVYMLFVVAYVAFYSFTHIPG